MAWPSLTRSVNVPPCQKRAPLVATRPDCYSERSACIGSTRAAMKRRDSAGAEGDHSDDERGRRRHNRIRFSPLVLQSASVRFAALPFRMSQGVSGPV